MLSLRLFRPGVPQGREEKAFLPIKWRIHLIDGAVQQPRFRFMNWFPERKQYKRAAKTGFFAKPP